MPNLRDADRNTISNGDLGKMGVTINILFSEYRTALFPFGTILHSQIADRRTAELVQVEASRWNARIEQIAAMKGWKRIYREKWI